MILSANIFCKKKEKENYMLKIKRRTLSGTAKFKGLRDWVQSLKMR